METTTADIVIERLQLRAVPGRTFGYPGHYTSWKWTYKCDGPDGTHFTNDSITELRSVLRRKYGSKTINIVEPWKVAALSENAAFQTEPPPMAYLHPSRYDIGHTVWCLTLHPHKYWRRCPICKGEGRVRIAGHEELTTYCPSGASGIKSGPRCSNGKVWEERGGQYYNVRQLTIGQIKVIVGPESDVEYMCEETGVGSGNIWRENQLFQTREDAVEWAREQGAIEQREFEVAS